MQTKLLGYALAGSQIVELVLRLQREVDLGNLTPEEAEAKAAAAWNESSARVQSADDRWERIDAAVRAKEGG